VSLLRSLANLLPTSVEALKAARREVSRLHSQLGNTFATFQARGPAIFDDAAFYWRIIWCVYFLVLLPLSALMMYYAMWAGGYFGGPEAIHEEVGLPPVRTCSERFWACFRACSVCSQKYHDTQLCFWSAVLLMEAVALVIFVVTILLCILGGVKMLLMQGCGEIYVLHDEAVCTEALANVRRFMDTFLLDESMSAMNGIELDKACGQYNLLTCDMIVARMKSSTLLTTVFSFLATLFSLQLIIDSAVMHEQATFRRLAATVSEGAIAQAAASSS
jgi:CheY-like chemotaxis protein